MPESTASTPPGLQTRRIEAVGTRVLDRNSRRSTRGFRFGDDLRPHRVRCEVPDPDGQLVEIGFRQRRLRGIDVGIGVPVTVDRSGVAVHE